MAADSIHRRSSCSPQSGVTVLEILVIVVIVAALAAIGVPTLHARSENAILDANMRGLASLVGQEVMAGYSAEYRPSGGGSSDRYLSTHLEALLQELQGKARYMNPYDDRKEAYGILNSDSLPADQAAAPPAVYITAGAYGGYDGFDSQPAALTRQRLVGSLVIHFHAEAGTVDVFYVDSKGNKSSKMVGIPAT